MTVRAETEITLVRTNDGDDGYSPTATVTKSGDTATITITDKNGTTTETVSDGQDGAQGISVTGVQTQYYLSTSSSTTTGGSWSDEQPEFISGKFYWTRDKITYSNNTTGYSTAVYAQGLTLANEYALDAKDVAITAASDAASAASSAASAESSASSAATDAANAAADASTAATNATNAANSANTAATQATNAASSASTAETAALNAASSASSAQQSASNAESSALSSETAATTASNAATTAANNAISAASSASTAATQATNAANSASNAESSAQDAANSASSAESSASSAATDAANAAADASTAATQATNAASSASSAATSASNAESSASSAATDAASAAADASSAATSASNAESSASSAAADASSASTSASQAATSASNAESSASSAASSASSAASSAASAESDASTAATQATNAANSASSAASDASAANTSAGNAATSASQAASSASQAASDASTAASQASQAVSSASAAQTAASAAQTAATQAVSDASAAQTAATAANTSANSALASLSVVEDVLGMAQWIAEHGTYTLTSDTSIVDGKVYFTRTGAGTTQDPYVYTPVANPVASELSTYYELSLDDEVANYIATHLALTNDGLFIIKDNNGYKLKLTNNGAYILNEQGTQVAMYGATTTIGQVASGLYNTYIDSNGVNIRLNQTTIAKFGSTTTIGKYENIGDSQWIFDPLYGAAKFRYDENAGGETPLPYDIYGFYVGATQENGDLIPRWSFGAPAFSPTTHGRASMYLGIEGYAFAPRSTVMGWRTTTDASAIDQTVIGRYNDNTDTTSAFVIGNGNHTSGSDMFSNAFTVDWDGNVTAGTYNGVDVTQMITSPNIPYCTCATAAGTAAKTTTIVSGTFTSDDLVAGAQVIVKFTNSNTVANPTLKIGSTTAKSIKRYGTTAPSTSAASSWNAGSVISFLYDGTYWQMCDWINTTYSSMTVAEIEAGTGTTARSITPARLKTAVETWSPVTSVNGSTGVVTISVPTKTSDLTNDSGYITDAGVTSFNGSTGAVTYTAPVTSVNGDTGAVTISVPSKTSDLTNDSGFLTSAVTSFNGNTGAVTYTAPVTSVNTKTGAITLSASDVSAVPTTRTVNGKALSANISLTASDVNALPDTTSIPTKTSDLQNDSGFISSVPVTSVNTKTGAVVLSSSDVGALSSTGGDVEGNITLKAAAGQPSPSLIFQRGTLTDNYNDWQIYDKSGFLYFGQRGSGSTAFADQVYFNTTGGVIATSFTGSGTNLTDVVHPTRTINGKALSSDITLTASDVGALADTYTAPVTSVNSKTGAVTLTATDVGALADTTSIPANTSDLNNDSGFISDTTSIGNTPFTPTSGASYAYYGGCYYEKYGRVVHVHIGVSGLSANAQTQIYTLPNGYIPSSLIVAHGTSGTWDGLAYAEITTAGLVNVRSKGTYCCADLTYLV